MLLESRRVLFRGRYEDHVTDPVSEWFVGETDRGRLLKIIFVFREGNLYLKSAYPANDKTQRIYKDFKPI